MVEGNSMFNLKSLFTNKEIHDVKNKNQSRMLENQNRAKKQAESSREPLVLIRSSRMYKIAVATGGKNRGL